MNSNPSRKLLVTGASGNLGKLVLEFLLEAKAGPISAATRNPKTLSALASRGIEISQADFDDEGTLLKAFSGVQRLLLISTSAIEHPGQRLRQHLNAIAAAKKTGVEHIVYTSLTHPDPDSPISIAPDHWATEQALRESGLTFTILRNNLYTEFLLDKLVKASHQGQLVAAAGTGGASYVTREDCARAAAAALMSGEKENAIFEISGPGAVSQADLAKIAGELSGRPVAYVAVEASAMKHSLTQAGVPPAVIEMLVSFDVAISQGFLSVSSHAVKEMTGKAAESVSDFMLKNRQAFQ